MKITIIQKIQTFQGVHEPGIKKDGGRYGGSSSRPHSVDAIHGQWDSDWWTNVGHLRLLLEVASSQYPWRMHKNAIQMGDIQYSQEAWIPVKTISILTWNLGPNFLSWAVVSFFPSSPVNFLEVSVTVKLPGRWAKAWKSSFNTLGRSLVGSSYRRVYILD